MHNKANHKRQQADWTRYARLCWRRYASGSFNMDYKTSVELALHLGYEEVNDPQAFKGRYFIKDGKKWIHDIEALMRHLGVGQFADLESLGYDLNNYHSYKDYSNEMARQEMQSIYQGITHCDGEATYLSDGMWLLPDGTLEER